MKRSSGTVERFVVLTTQRNGSTWLMSLLNRVDGVAAHGELFLPRSRKQGVRRWDSDFAYPRYVERKADGPSLRPFSTFSYLTRLHDQPDLVGFKLMYSQLRSFPEILGYLIRHRVPVVHLIRENHLDVLISSALMAELGRAHILSGEEDAQELRVRLETDGLVDRLEWLERKHRIARTMLALTRLPSIEIAYEKAVQDEEAAFRSIWEFLSLDGPVQVPESNVVRIRKGGQAEIVENYDAVATLLLDSPFASLLD